ncbi:MAG TPA: cytochrome c peroxidase [Pirellulales bacterium]|nr:cytochrome c peroxidase [Pirellulales bacterium]
MQRFIGFRVMFGLGMLVSLIAVGCEPAVSPKPTAKVVGKGDVASPPDEGSPSGESAADTKMSEAGPVEPTPSGDSAVTEPTSGDEAESKKLVLGADPEMYTGIPGDGPLTLEQVEKWLEDPKNNEVLDFELPLGLAAGAAQIQGVAENPLTRAKIELGRQLYFDPRLSADGTVSCASCHTPDEGFARHTQFGVGISGQLGGRNSPPSYNRILSGAQFWDGRAKSLEDQAVGPIANPIEMGNTHEAAVAAIKKSPIYEKEFQIVFGELSIDAVAKAIASFERTLVTGPSPFDYAERLRPYAEVDIDELKTDDPDTYQKYLSYKEAAEQHPMSESATRGREIFFGTKGGCTACHVGANFTDEKYHNLGVGTDVDQASIDAGRQAITKDDKDFGAFKTPTVRNIEHSFPYMHDGSQKTLEEVVEWYAKGGHPNPHLDEKIKKLDLSDQDKQDLVAFLKACSGDFPKVERGRFPQ